jgi:hypothetical protein
MQYPQNVVMWNTVKNEYLQQNFTLNEAIQELWLNSFSLH